MRDDSTGFWLGVALVVTSVLWIWAAVAEAKEWDQFKAAHNCKVVGKKRSETITTIDTNGNVAFGSTSGQTGWACDDGITYWR